jgi:hypothetical protein
MDARDVEGEAESSSPAQGMGALLEFELLVLLFWGEVSGVMAGDAWGDSSARKWSLAALNPELLNESKPPLPLLMMVLLSSEKSKDPGVC